VRVATVPDAGGLRAVLFGGQEPAQVTAVAVLLHGGKEESHAPVQPRQVAVLRMAPVARQLRLAGLRAGLAVWRLLFACRGWNGDGARAIEDVRWAIKQLQTRYGDAPVVLVGHSLGGRVAVRAAGERGVAGVVALAPWITPGEPREQLGGRRMLIVHGTRDRITSYEESRRYAASARSIADEACFVGLRGCGHAMVRRVTTWNRLTAEYVLHAGMDADLGPVLAAARARGEVRQ
jgi:predicted esterase